MNQKKIKILLVQGSPRKNSKTFFSLNYLKHCLHKLGHYAEIVDLIDLDIPLFVGSYTDLPDSVKVFYKKLKSADLIVIATPEYHGSVSGILKNALDWIKEDFLMGKYAAIFAVMGGKVGGTSLEHLRVILTELGMWVSPTQTIIFRSSDVFTKNGQIKDSNTKLRIEKFAKSILNHSHR